jgi:acetylglutamate kinase
MLDSDDPDQQVFLFKYGGNAMTNNKLKNEILKNICSLHAKGHAVIIVHGGGPFIKKALEKVKIESEFIDGHRKTTPEAYEYVEMALKGSVNGSLVGMINAMGFKAVGLSGKDGAMVTATKRFHKRIHQGKEDVVDLGQVGDVADVNPTLINLLIENNYIPVVTCVASDKAGIGYNINADMFAGHLAGALRVSQYIVLTDVDGLLEDKNDSNSLIKTLRLPETNRLIDKGVIAGGMIPKIESCQIAINKGAQCARIVNGTKPGQVTQILDGRNTGTLITE